MATTRAESLHTLRHQLAAALAWGDAHVSFDGAVRGLPHALRGRRPRHFPHSAWELVEHLRRTQQDLLEFCRNPAYKPLNWPTAYWPPAPTPPSDAAWAASVRAFRRDRAALQSLVEDTALDLEARVPHGTGQTYTREILLALDHAAYHVGQLIALRHLLQAWPPD
jgi:DinB family protein